MQTLRNASLLARLVLAWFALSLGVAVASPVVQPKAMELVCSAGGAVLLQAQVGDGGDPVASHLLDCPLCLIGYAPPPVIVAVLPGVLPLARAVQPIPAARIAGLTAAPLPARGPPHSS